MSDIPGRKGWGPKFPPTVAGRFRRPEKHPALETLARLFDRAWENLPLDRYDRAEVHCKFGELANLRHRLIGKDLLDTRPADISKGASAIDKERHFHLMERWEATRDFRALETFITGILRKYLGGLDVR